MHYCINSLLKNNNEIMQYCIISNDIALLMHYRALLQMPDINFMVESLIKKKKKKTQSTSCPGEMYK